MSCEKVFVESRSLSFGLAARERKNRGLEVLSLGLGEPEFDTPLHIKEAAKRAIDEGKTRYGPAPGMPVLREAIAEKLQRDNGIVARAEEIVVTPGAKSALHLAFTSILKPGDQVINLTPCYVSNEPIIRISEYQTEIVNVPMRGSDYEVDWNEVVASVNEKTKAIFINYPHNPTGGILRKKDAEILAGIVAGRDIWVVSDEIYDRIEFGDGKNVSPGSLTTISDRVITIGGFSKPYSMTGWRIGYLHAEKEVARRAAIASQHVNTNTAEFVQMGALAALNGCQAKISEYNEKLRQRVAHYLKLLAENPYLSGAEPKGGFFAFLDISKTGLSSDAFAKELIDQKGVVVIPGISFGEDFDSHCRVSFVNDTDTVKEGLRRMGEFAVEQVEGNRK